MLKSRREFLTQTSAALATGLLYDGLSAASGAEPRKTPGRMQLGLVTYNWGKDWDVPTVITNCVATGFSGVELRSTHKHGVEISLDAAGRKKVRRQFEDSPVELVGLGSACEYHSADPAVVTKNIEETKAFIKLCRDVGGSGVKVRPNGFPKDVPMDKTLEQIGHSLNEVAKFGADYGVTIRLEIHGRGTQELPHIRRMMDVADHPNTVLCWNCNPTDLDGEGLEKNFRLVQDRIGILHIHDLRNDAYPWGELFPLLKSINFSGWTLLEEGKVPDDIVAAMHENRTVWNKLTAN
jgi:sugar phosphate isomerase/epimerase